MLQFFDKFIQALFAKNFINDFLVFAYSQKNLQINHPKLYYHNKLVTKFYSDVNIDNLLATNSESKET